MFEHEIPAGSRLYVGVNARKKRIAEQQASELLSQEGFDEIVTPIFSYHQHQSVREKNALVRLNDPQNLEVSLRADSTLDVVRLVRRRLGRSFDQKRWFYIQPVYRYPTHEINQIGGEIIDGSLDEALLVSVKLFERLGIAPVLQISNIRIPRLIHEHLGVPIDLFASMQVEKLLDTPHAWLGELTRLQHIEQLDGAMQNAPEWLREELERMRGLALSSHYAPIVLAPLYYARLRYYDGLFFKAFVNNRTMASGGHFENDEIRAAGFALYTDAILAHLAASDEKR